MNLTRRPVASSSTPARFPSILDEFFNEPFFMFAPAGAGASANAGLAIDLSETESDVRVRASLPGFSRDDIAIQVHDGVLTIHAEKSEEREESGEHFHRRERRTGSLSRSIALPVAVADEQAKAELKDGVLTLTLPKSPTARPKKIAIT